MKESISNAFLFNIIIIFVIIMIAFFVGSLSYSKAFKVKNKIVEEIEKEGENSTDPATAYTRAEDDITEWLNAGDDGNGIGYRPKTNAVSGVRCNNDRGTLVSQSSDYQYCVYMINTCTNGRENKCGVYYRVTAYMFFDIPIIGDMIQIPVSGETMIFQKIES